VQVPASDKRAGDRDVEPGLRKAASSLLSDLS
jgi:hypothetical protein